MVEIIDDFLDEEDFQRLQQMFLSPDMAWFYNPHVNYEGEDIGGLSQFVHVIYSEVAPMSPVYEHIRPILLKLKPFAICRIKANLIVKHPEVVEHGYHIDLRDMADGFKTSVFYLNDNDGYTKFKDGTKVESKANRLVTFDGLTPHTGTTTTDDRRIVLNLNWMPAGPERDAEGNLIEENKDEA